jgi:hypothetical protein
LYSPLDTQDLFCRMPKLQGQNCSEGAEAGQFCDKKIEASEATFCQKAGGVVIQKISEQTGVTGIVFSYMQKLVKLTFGIGFAISLLMMVVSGIQIMIGAGDASATSFFKDVFEKGVLGLIMLILSGMILRFINPLFFV